MNPFTRTCQLIGSDSVEAIHQAKVAIFGLGAVGGFALEGLARCGIGYLRLIDSDQMEASNLNRQILGLHSTIGKPKVELAKNRVLDIFPDCHVEIHSSFVNGENLEQFLTPDLDVVIDAIDGLNSKVNLIYEARQMGLKVLSSMGAAGRTDLSKIHVADIKDTQVCPLARVVRRRLHRRGLFEGVECVFSTEVPRNKNKISPGDLEEEDMKNFCPENGRPRPPIGSIIWVPAVFGMTLAARAVEHIIQTVSNKNGQL